MKAWIEFALLLPFIVAGFIWQGICRGFNDGRGMYVEIMK